MHKGYFILFYILRNKASSLTDLTFFIVFLLVKTNLVYAQSLPNNHFNYQSRKLLYDIGKDWKSLTVFGPIRFKLDPQKKNE